MAKRKQRRDEELFKMVIQRIKIYVKLTIIRKNT